MQVGASKTTITVVLDKGREQFTENEHESKQMRQQNRKRSEAELEIREPVNKMEILGFVLNYFGDRKSVV